MKPKKVIRLRVDDKQSTPPPDARAQIQILRDRITGLVQADPRKAATILTDWIHKSAKKKSA